MAYTVSGNTVAADERHGGRTGERITSFVVLETGGIDPATVGDEFSIPVPTLCTMVVVEVELVTAGTAATIQPEIGVASEWTVDTIDDVVKAAAAATYHRIVDRVAVYAPTEKLYCRSMPNADTGATGAVTWRITFIEGASA